MSDCQTYVLMRGFRVQRIELRMLRLGLGLFRMSKAELRFYAA